MLELILPQLNAAYDLVTNVKILNILEELELKENLKENLCTEYQELIQKETEIRFRLAKDNEILERLHAVITDLYVDWERAKRSRRYVLINIYILILTISVNKILYFFLSKNIIFLIFSTLLFNGIDSIKHFFI